MRIPFLSSPPRIALLRLSGLIAARGGSPFGGGLNDAATGPLIERAFGLKRLAAVVLVINSPGGSPVQSALLANRIRRLAQEKQVPVIACVEDAAASGGYWIACAADEIVVDPASIVGSIGVISAGFGLEGAMRRLGVERRLRTAGTEKSFLDPFRPEDPGDVARLEALLGELHDEFKTWVRARRGSRLKDSEDALFSGRFWTGRDAVAKGIADQLGDAEGLIRARFGKEARILRIGRRRPPIPFRWLPGAGDVAAAIEERAAWSRLGL
jgi:serine protease SohB